jgi:TctA family transporter
MACIGLLLGSVGTDGIHGVDRFTFGTLYLQDGIGLVPLAMGLFGMGEILYNIERREETGSVLKTPRNLLPTRQDWKDSGWPIARGSLLGFGFGILPGGMPAYRHQMHLEIASNRISAPGLSSGFVSQSHFSVEKGCFIWRNIPYRPLTFPQRF